MCLTIEPIHCYKILPENLYADHCHWKVGYVNHGRHGWLSYQEEENREINYGLRLALNLDFDVAADEMVVACDVYQPIAFGDVEIITPWCNVLGFIWEGHNDVYGWEYEAKKREQKLRG